MIDPTKDDETEISYWLNEIEQAKKRDENFRKTGNKVLDIYSAKETGRVPFNILYSNTDTLLPALYSSIPRPAVSQRFKDDVDPIIEAAAMASNRMLEYLLDTGRDGYETFDEGMRNATLDALLPGRGVTRIKYDAEISENGDDYATKDSELVCVDSIVWDRVLFGYAKKWSQIPWVAFEEHIDKDEAVRLFGKEKAGKLQFLKNDDVTDDDKKSKTEQEKQGGEKTACIYQIWDRDEKVVRYISMQYKDDFLKVEDDPLGLTGFFPIPKPILFLEQSHCLDAVAPYSFYENQAKEINTLTTRITRLATAIKAKGIYDAELGSDIENLMSGDDNEFIPADKSSTLSADKGFQNAIWFLPIAEMVGVLNNLYAAREQCKQVIYEVTGISDIIRGATVASETATAQGLKSQWGTMRLKRMQGEVQRYARDMLRIMLEIAATKFSEETWVQMTGLKYATEGQVMMAQQVIAMAKQVKMSMPPEQLQLLHQQYEQQLQQAQQVLQQVKWSDVINLLKNDMQRCYKIDIETNSTVLPEAIEDQKNIADVMTALGQYLQGVTPLIQSGAFPFEAAKAMMMSIVKRYQFGDKIEQYIDEMKPPAPPEQPQAPPDNTLQIKQLDLQAKQQELQVKAQLDQAKIETDRIIAQGKAQTEMHIEQAKAEAGIEFEKWKLQVETDNAFKLAQFEAMEREKQWRADIDARILLAQMSISELAQAETGQEEVQDNTELQGLKDSMDSLMNYLNSPRQITLPDGRTVTLQ